MFKVLKPFIVIVALSIASTTVAEIVLDGTFGSKGTLSGPNFAIEASLGKLEGNNLFHSFSTFNLDSKETATFLGSNDIENIISRVTGDEISNIDGTLRSTMPNADFYFLNPAGIIFGPNAELDVQGSFYVSTADYLRFQDGKEFHTYTSKESLLTVASPSAFGFLETSLATISNEGGKIKLKEGKTLSFIGGDLNFKNGSIEVPNGKINLISTGSEGKVPISDYELKTFDKLGKIIITDETKGTANKDREIANIDVSGTGGGKIFIHGGQIILDNGYVFADTQGKNDGQGINVKATEELILKNGGRITTDTKNSGNAGHIKVTARNINFLEGSQIASTSKSTGMAGNVTICADREIYIAGHFPQLIDNKILSSGIFTRAFWTGRGGDVNIFSPSLNMKEGIIDTNTNGFSDAGNILIDVDTLTLKKGSQINVNIGSRDGWNATISTGHAGELTIKAKKHILISGQYDKNMPSGLLSNTFTPGNGGKINISSPLFIEIGNDGTIQTGTQNSGNAGSIIINTNMLNIYNGGFITAESRGLGRSGTVDITTNNFIIPTNLTKTLFNSSDFLPKNCTTNIGQYSLSLTKRTGLSEVFP